ncbi:DUF2786 domain-containing protein [Treponema zuelzerae]|uniref:DUF2786 domain-containing protein n=1 Tax=Teretinema zuelzerae TaxID=156 RepID=A0AAE3ELA9_9SPIR|nr:DUF2786 domain-containing protein [Teretinema zuelzerae]MCD1655474.1 DUF2786 domain-containing protein [Teretinema zuelzerae]
MDKAAGDVLDKVKKLMALGASPSEAEAASAIEKARLLLARHGLTLTDLEAHDPEIVEGVLLEKKRLRSWESMLIQVVARATFTQALHVRRGDCAQILLIGREVNTAAAENLFEYLYLIVLKLGREHSSQVAHLESFKCGVVERIGERLIESIAGEEADAKAQSPDGEKALALRMDKTAEKENKNFIENKYGKTGSKRIGRRVEAESYLRGRTEGGKVSLNRQIRSDQAGR